MKKSAKKALKHEIERRVVKTVKRDVKRKARRGAGRFAGKLALIGLAAFVGTFSIYMFNIENKLIYNVIYPFLQKHYNAQTRDRRV